MSDPVKLAVVWLILLSVVGFVLVAVDKRRARKGLWRIPEKTLFATAFMGGSLGVLVGMKVFHHKTKKNLFVWGVPLIIVLQVAFLSRLFL
jgi:uncharacterized membrane protein YsdA (DUF1294 family)